ncbi:MAG TPA: c-type cytochrome [Gemmatimonadales bacterium]|nr:c-type cytochrome [Gemmatimonadales bacterium]
MSTPRTSPLARLLGAMAVAVLFVVGGARAAHAQEVHDKYHPQPLDTISVEAYQGWKQFELNCARCHGEYGVGSSFAPALVNSLKDDGPIPTKAIFVATVCAGRPAKGMPSWCALGLEPEKINNIYAYLKGRADGKIHIGRPAVKSGA